MSNLIEMRGRAEWAIEYGSHSSDVSEANEESEQFGRDVLALLTINDDLLAAYKESIRLLELWPAAEWGWRELEIHEVLTTAIAKAQP